MELSISQLTWLVIVLSIEFKTKAVSENYFNVVYLENYYQLKAKG